MSAPSLAPYIMKRPWLLKWMKPLSNWYCNAAGYRQLGLKYDSPSRSRQCASAVLERAAAAVWCPRMDELTSFCPQGR